MKLSVILLLLFSNIGMLLCQENTPIYKPLNGKEVVKVLSEGTLIVRLSRFEGEIERIRAYNGDQKAAQEEENIESANKNLITEFETDYSFSKVVFAYDVDLYEYLQDSTQYVFLNQELKIDSSIIVTSPIFILSSQGNKFYQLHDENFSLIEKPKLEFTNQHYKRNYQFFIAQVAEFVSRLFSRNIPVDKFNKKLKRIMDS